MRDLAKKLSILFVCVSMLVLLAACSKDSKLADSITKDSATDITPEITATPEPTPEPVYATDISEAVLQEMAAGNRVTTGSAVVITAASIVANVNPFSFEGSINSDAVSRTQLPLFEVNADGNVVSGIESKGLLYDCEELTDLSKFGLDNTVSTDYTAYKLILKGGLKFSDGTPVELKDVLFSLYTYADPLYDGNVPLYKSNIYGMQAYHIQVPAQTIENTKKILKAGILPDGSFPLIAGIEKEEQEKVWGCMDEAGVFFAQDIIDYVNEEYNSNHYVQAFLSTNLTIKHIESDDKLKTAYAMAIWGFVDRFDSKKRTLTDLNGNVFNIDSEDFNASVLWKEIFDAIGYNLDPETGINYEKGGSKSIEDYIEQVYYEKYRSNVDRIEGVSYETVVNDDGIMRDCLYVLLTNNSNLTEINFYIVPAERYRILYKGEVNEFGTATGSEEYMTAVSTRSIKTLGAGAYEVSEIKNDTIELTANQYYHCEIPAATVIRYEVEAEEQTEE